MHQAVKSLCEHETDMFWSKLLLNNLPSERKNVLSHVNKDKYVETKYFFLLKVLLFSIYSLEIFRLHI